MLHRLRILGLSLIALLMAASLGLWVRSFSVHDLVYYSHIGVVANHWNYTAITAKSFRCRVQLRVDYDRGIAPANLQKNIPEWTNSFGWRPISIEHDRLEYWFDPKGPHWLGFQIERIDVTRLADRLSIRGVQMPFWFVLLLPTLTVCVLARKPMRDRWRRGQLRCVGCGYDLRASKDRCPECGLAAPSSATAENATNRPSNRTAQLWVRIKGETRSLIFGMRIMCFILSILLSIISVGLWSRSHHMHDLGFYEHLAVTSDGQHFVKYCVDSDQGGFQLYATVDHVIRPPRSSDYDDRLHPTNQFGWRPNRIEAIESSNAYYFVPSAPHWAGFQIRPGDYASSPGRTTLSRGVQGPFWFVILMLIISAICLGRKPICARWRGFRK